MNARYIPYAFEDLILCDDNYQFSGEREGFGMNVVYIRSGNGKLTAEKSSKNKRGRDDHPSERDAIKKSKRLRKRENIARAIEKQKLSHLL